VRCTVGSTIAASAIRLRVYERRTVSIGRPRKELSTSCPCSQIDVYLLFSKAELSTSKRQLVCVSGMEISSGEHYPKQSCLPKNGNFSAGAMHILPLRAGAACAVGTHNLEEHGDTRVRTLQIGEPGVQALRKVSAGAEYLRVRSTS